MRKQAHITSLTAAQRENLKKVSDTHNQFIVALHGYLKCKCPDLASAKTWIGVWANKQSQLFPEIAGFECHCASRKWMAAFLSGILERKSLEVQSRENHAAFHELKPDQPPRYFETRFGSELFASIDGVTSSD